MHAVARRLACARCGEPGASAHVGADDDQPGTGAHTRARSASGCAPDNARARAARCAAHSRACASSCGAGARARARRAAVQPRTPGCPAARVSCHGASARPKCFQPGSRARAERQPRSAVGASPRQPCSVASSPRANASCHRASARACTPSASAHVPRRQPSALAHGRCARARAEPRARSAAGPAARRGRADPSGAAACGPTRGVCLGAHACSRCAARAFGEALSVVCCSSQSCCQARAALSGAHKWHTGGAPQRRVSLR